MTELEWAQTAAVLKAVYTAPSFIPDKTAMHVWYGLLKDMDYRVVQYNAQRHMQTETRIPTVADLRRDPMTERNEMLESEAWALVSKALRNGIYGAEEEFAKLPHNVQKAVGSPAQLRVWAMDESYSESVVSSLFGRSYRLVIQREEADARLSDNTKALLAIATGRGDTNVNQLGGCGCEMPLLSRE